MCIRGLSRRNIGTISEKQSVCLSGPDWLAVDLVFSEPVSA